MATTSPWNRRVLYLDPVRQNQQPAAAANLAGCDLPAAEAGHQAVEDKPALHHPDPQ